MSFRYFWVLVSFIFLSLSAYSQTEEGTFLVSGAINPTFSSLGKSKNTTIEGTVKSGYFLLNNYSLGLSVDLQNSHFKNSSAPNESKMTVWSFNLFNRYYVRKDKLGLFAEAGLGISLLNFQITMPVLLPDIIIDYNSNYNFLNVKGGLGVDYFITPNVAAELFIYYKYNDKVKSSPFYYYPKNQFASAIGFTVFIP